MIRPQEFDGATSAGGRAMHLDLNLKQLKVFYYAAKHLSLTRAAEELFVTQPAVAMQLKSLEAHLQTALFIRKNNRLELTEAGSLCSGTLSEWSTSPMKPNGPCMDLKQTTGAILRIGATKTLARHLMPSYIPRFQELHPEIHIQLGDGSSRELMDSVLEGRIDLAIVGRVAYEPDLDFMPFPGHEADELMLTVMPESPTRDKATGRLHSGIGRVLHPAATRVGYPPDCRASGPRTRCASARAARGGKP